MSVQARELNALSAYLRLLESKGMAGESLLQRKALLSTLMEAVAGQPQDGSAYRECVEQVLQRTEKAMWPAFLAVTREYYYFWIDDIKSIASMHSSGGYGVAMLPRDVPEEDLRTLWEGLDHAKFSVAENWPLKAYAAALRDEGADKAVVETRCKLVKLLLVRLRGVEGKDSAHYRNTVDCAVPLFSMKETRQLFLIVVREFFYFWIGDPDAPAHIVLSEPPTES